jgi:CheY-like chemotaxis protein
MGVSDMPAKTILWIDNDIPYLRPYVRALKNRGDEVEVVASLGEAEKLLNLKGFDLIIIDVMVPTQTEDEVKNYPIDKSDFGHKTGLIFYNRIRERLANKLPAVAVMTVRLDQDIKDEFVLNGLKAENFLTKYSVRDVSRFLKKIDSILTSEPAMHVE